MSRRVSKQDVHALVEVINSLAHHLGLMQEGFTLHFQSGSRSNGQPHYLYVERDTDSGRQRTHLPEFAPEFSYKITLTEAFNLLIATKKALSAVVNQFEKDLGVGQPTH
ncbi:hypothetical protein FDH86_gp098 [Arthrobacter phage Tank]|uniref:Uncharacterized protein n=1 Tax=Arthrobacter phage Tank TaxID=1772319 RepID=A0A0U3TNF0_9CAUD|nr:hypothetical protein FDH86_gp098 [Arthrobacter phage Tank]ALY10633.1 hypothetical protein TANK_98 [Arthrobacter phage Tank]